MRVVRLSLAALAVVLLGGCGQGPAGTTAWVEPVGGGPALRRVSVETSQAPGIVDGRRVPRVAPGPSSEGPIVVPVPLPRAEDVEPSSSPSPVGPPPPGSWTPPVHTVGPSPGRTYFPR